MIYDLKKILDIGEENGFAVSERYTTVDCGKTGRRFSLLRMDRSRWGWALREDGT